MNTTAENVLHEIGLYQDMLKENLDHLSQEDLTEFEASDILSEIGLIEEIIKHLETVLNS